VSEFWKGVKLQLLHRKRDEVRWKVVEHISMLGEYSFGMVMSEPLEMLRRKDFKLHTVENEVVPMIMEVFVEQGESQ